MKKIKFKVFLYLATLSLSSHASEQTTAESTSFNKEVDVTYLSRYEVDRSNESLEMLARLVLTDPTATRLITDGDRRSFIYNDDLENLKFFFLNNRNTINTDVEILNNYIVKNVEIFNAEEERECYVFEQISVSKSVPNFVKLAMFLHMKLGCEKYNGIKNASYEKLINKLNGYIKHFEVSCLLTNHLQ